MTRIRCLWANTDAVGCGWQNLRIQSRFVAETNAEQVEIAETLKALIRKKSQRKPSYQNQQRDPLRRGVGNRIVGDLYRRYRWKDIHPSHARSRALRFAMTYI
jgi:hypothetical protein